MKKGKLVRVELQPGRFVKMFEADAVAQGLIEKKKRPASGDKMRRPGGDKGNSPSPQPPPTGRGSMASADEAAGEEKAAPLDDFTVIEGIGPATARALQARGIKTFEELRAANDLGFLSSQAQTAIEQWRDDDTN